MYNYGVRPKSNIQNVAVFLIIAIFFLHVGASFLHLYFIFFWWDMMLHFLAGAWLAFLFSWMFYSRIAVMKEKAQAFYFIIGLVATVALLWEGFEFGLQEFLGIDILADPIDSLSDLLLGVSGGAFAFLYIFPNAKTAFSNNEI